MKLRSPKTYTGIDIGSGSIKMVGILQHERTYELLFRECIDLAATYSLHGLRNLQGRHYTEQLAELGKKHRTISKPVSISVSAEGGIAHLIRFEAVPMESAFTSLVQDELERAMGAPIENMSVSCHQCKSRRYAMEVVACGIPNPALERTRAILDTAGFKKIEGLELDAISLYNAYLALKGELLYESILLVSIGAKKTDCIGIAHGANPLFFRIDQGTETIIEAMTSEFALDWAEGVEILRTMPHLKTDSEGDPEAMVLRRSLSEFFDLLFPRLKGCLRDLRTMTANPGVSKILLTGGFALMNELPNVVETALEVSTEVWNPFKDLRTHIPGIDDGVRFSCALGAAIGGMPWN